MHKLQICIWKLLQSYGYLKMDLTTSNCSDIVLTTCTVNKMKQCSKSQQSVIPVRQHGRWSETQVGHNTTLVAEATQHLFMTLWNHRREAENFNCSPNCPSVMSDFGKYCNTGNAYASLAASSCLLSSAVRRSNSLDWCRCCCNSWRAWSLLALASRMSPSSFWERKIKRWSHQNTTNKIKIAIKSKAI